MFNNVIDLLERHGYSVPEGAEVVRVAFSRQSCEIWYFELDATGNRKKYRNTKGEEVEIAKTIFWNYP